MMKTVWRNNTFRLAAGFLALCLAYALIVSPARAEGEDGVSLDKPALDLCPGDTFTLTATTVPPEAAATLVWTTSDGSIAAVSGGVVTAGATGHADITATTADGIYSAVCAVTVKAGELQTTAYTVDRASGLLLGVQKLTTPDLLFSNFGNAASDLGVLDKDGNPYNGASVGTGMTVRLTVNGIQRDALKVIVKGDANGDGAVSISDYSLARLDILGLKKLTGEYALAGDVNGDGAISISDYSLMRLDILGLKPIGGSTGVDLSGITDPRIKSFLECGLAQLGKPYVWGAEGPDSFDCSGFVYYCLNQTGYRVGRTTADGYSKYTSWQYVPKSGTLQPGDLMFFYSDDHPGTIGHVGVYLGGGKLINASFSRGCIVICPFSGWYVDKLSHARRVFN